MAGPGAGLDATVQGKDVYLVMSPPTRAAGRVTVLLDGRPITPAQAGDDVRRGVVDVRSQRLYHLVHLRSVQRHRLTLKPSAGVGAYAFTFG